MLSRRTGGVNGPSTFYTFDPQGNVCQRFGNQGAYMSTDMYDAFGAAAHSAGYTPDVFGYGAQAGYYTDTETGSILLTNGSQ